MLIPFASEKPLLIALQIAENSKGCRRFLSLTVHRILFETPVWSHSCVVMHFVTLWEGVKLRSYTCSGADQRTCMKTGIHHSFCASLLCRLTMAPVPNSFLAEACNRRDFPYIMPIICDCSIENVLQHGTLHSASETQACRLSGLMKGFEYFRSTVFAYAVWEEESSAKGSWTWGLMSYQQQHYTFKCMVSLME